LEAGPGASAADTVNSLLQTVRGIPIHPERRVKQAVQLAQRLLQSEAQVDMG